MVPAFAITIPRPYVWLVSHGYKRDWQLRNTDSGRFLVGQEVALHSASAGDADGWVRFDVWADGKVARKQVAAEAPHNAIVGVARVIRLDHEGRLVFEACRCVEAVGAIDSGEFEFWPLPSPTRAQLSRALALRTEVQHG